MLGLIRGINGWDHQMLTQGLWIRHVCLKVHMYVATCSYAYLSSENLITIYFSA